MIRPSTRTLLLITSGVVITGGTIGAQIANAIVLAGFYEGESAGACRLRLQRRIRTGSLAWRL
jgi:hypothetical protein